MAEAPPSQGADPNLARIVHRNIRALIHARREIEQQLPREIRVADVITRFAGSMKFVYLHAALFGAWLIVNSGFVPGVTPFDPFPFVMLAMWASVEAIFLSTFVLISQNRMQTLADQRADLDLQISLLSEHEITRLVQLTDAIAQRVGARICEEDLEELKKDVSPEAVLREIDRAEEDDR